MSERFNKYLESARSSKKPVDIGQGLYVMRVGMDLNGNSSIWISRGSNRAQKIQMNGVLSDKSNILVDGVSYFSDKEKPRVKKTIAEIIDYWNKYMVKRK